MPTLRPVPASLMARLLARLLLAGVLVAVGLVGLTAAPSSACSCAVGGTARQLDAADAVFVGTLTAVEEPEPAEDGTVGSGDPVTYRFDVDRVHAGEVPSTVEVVSARLGATCGLEGMRVGVAYVVFAVEGRRGLESGLCSGTAPAAHADLDRLERLTGPPAEPTEPSERSVEPAVADLVAALLALLGLLPR